jgi:hypothetical protein
MAEEDEEVKKKRKEEEELRAKRKKEKMDTISEIHKKSINLETNASLYKKAHAADNSILWKDILEWKRRRQKSPMKGYNSCIANLPREQFQMDLANIVAMMKAIMQEKGFEEAEELNNMEWKYCFICTDVFSKRVFAKPQRTTQQEETKQNVKRAFEAMGIPKQIYTDRGNEFQGLGTLLTENNIQHLQTRTHAVFAERWIRFMKGRLDEKIDNIEDADRWYIWLNEIVKYYNNEYKNDTTKMTPKDAEQDKNAMDVKANIIMKSKHMRNYPDINKGDEVKVYQKPPKKQFEKSYNNKWIGPHKVTKTSMSNNTKYYHVDMDGIDTLLMRHELLKLNA